MRSTPSDGKLRWKFATDGERRFTAPGIHGAIATHRADARSVRRVPLFSGGRWQASVYFGSGDHHVYAVDAGSGALRWKFETGNVVHASPAVADGVVYIGSWDRNLYALNADNRLR